MEGKNLAGAINIIYTLYYAAKVKIKIISFDKYFEKHDVKMSVSALLIEAGAKNNIIAHLNRPAAGACLQAFYSKLWEHLEKFSP